ncbi:glycerol-3-phosphate dehydrogenase/oxidase [Aquimarina sp. TRL1]|uniref:glycerol-3-phosphate dehydrogenase/oxidase n=1 Tax=Aquimarina sp. (strain TRL1) TaxID=2736252 RepID=UPI001589D33A|nr:glycerol-3-phosphate dehydrogenase/oxidase [Aquimarina sp. TRL1]QKX04271.1 glycerol-3-phosphate dehydrogenase/oxidase [Aquimarina sp. TRL1]
MKNKRQFSVHERASQLKRVTSRLFDVVIIGGGVTGAGIALDAISRGLSVCLIEKNDFASGTSNKSTKLIHGGLRYLKQLEIGLVRESGRERAIVHKLAPHLVVPEKMLLPLYEGGTYGKLMTAIGLKVYDFLADVSGNDRRKMLSVSETIEQEPLLKKEGLQGGGYYAEYRTDDARLTIELLKKAHVLGAEVLNYCEVVSFGYTEEGNMDTAHCLDHITNEKLMISARFFVSATGPWSDVIKQLDTSKKEKTLQLSKGVHIVIPRDKLLLRQAIYFDVDDGRMIFAIPRGKVTYIGTTDTVYTASLKRIVITRKDVKYLIDAVNRMFPLAELTIRDVISSWAGIRPLVYEAGKTPSELSRKDEIFISKTGLVSIAGGKLTGYRKMAERIMNTLFSIDDSIGNRATKGALTDEIPLTNYPLQSREEVVLYRRQLKERLASLGVEDEYICWYLVSTYGKQADKILEKITHFNNEEVIEKLIRAELWYGVHHEMVVTLSDFFVRRTGYLYFEIEKIKTFRTVVASDLQNYLGFDIAEMAHQHQVLDQLLTDATTFYETE